MGKIGRGVRAFIGLMLCVCMLVVSIPASLVEAAVDEGGKSNSEVMNTASEKGGEASSVNGSVSSLQAEPVSRQTEEYLDESVTVDISALTDDNGDALTTALTGETLTALISAYNDNPNYTAEAVIRIYVNQISGNATIEPTEIPEVTLSGEGYTDSAEAVTVEAKWHEADGVNITIPYLEVTIPSGASMVFNLSLLCPTGYDKSASAQIYATVTETDESTGTSETSTYPEDSSDYLTFEWTGEADWSNFTKAASLAAIGVTKDSVIKADEVDWTFSAKNNTSESVGVVYTNYITLTDTLVLPEGLSVSDGTAVTDSSSVIQSVSGKQTVGEIHDANGDVVYAIFLDDTYKDDYTVDDLSVSVNADGQTEIAYSVTIKNPDVTNISFNPVSAISTAIYMDTFQSQAASASLAGKEMLNTAKLTVYSVIEDATLSAGSADPVYEMLYQDTAASAVSFDDTFSLDVSKAVYQVKDGIGNITYGYGLDRSVGSVLSNEKKDANGVPYVAQGYTVTYMVTVSSTFTTATEADMTDTIPSQLRLDTGSIVVKFGNNTLAENVSYTYEIETDSDNNTILKVHLVAVPANGSVVITYNCTVNDTATTELTTITNTAKVGDEEAEAVVKTPEDGTSEITREIVARTTTLTTGETVKICKNLDSGEYYCDATSNAIVGYFGTSSPSQSELADAILKVNAGDTIEYLITYENNSLEDVYGCIYESHLFSNAANYGSTALSYASFMIGLNAGGWNYYSMGCDVYYHTVASESGSMASYSVSTVTSTQDSLLNQCRYGYSDLEDWSYVKGTGNTDGTKRGRWQFYTGDPDDDVHVLHAYTTYHQTTIIQIPGDNKVSSAATANAGFQNVASAYAYYCSINNDYDWADYAIFTPSDVNGTVDSSNILLTDEYVHTVERQIYLNTGTLASTIVDDTSTLSTTNGLIKTKIAGTSSTMAANDYANSSRYFAADENSVVVNYVYLYNDSSEEMNLHDYSLSVVLPNGFEWVGFTYSYNTTSDSTGMYRTYSKTDASGVYLKNYYSYTNYSLWVNNTRSSGTSITPFAYVTTNSGYYNNAAYYSGSTSDILFPQTSSQMQTSGAYITNNYDSVTDNLVCSTNSSAGDTGTISFSFSNSNKDPVIAPYSGIVIMYVAKVSNESTVKNLYSGTGSSGNAAATFQAYIERVYNSEFGHSVNSSSYRMSQISPVIRAQDRGAITLSSGPYLGYRQYVSNDGNANSYLEHFLDWFYGASSTTLSGGTAANMSSGAAGNPTRMWSYVSLSMYVEKTSVSVTKEVVKNSGSDYVGQYSNGASQSQSYYNSSYFGLQETGGFASDYDDYLWNYSLLDGLHRTVDGTVTWKTTITNTGADTSGNTETETSVGVVYDYSTVNYSTLIDTVDSPYHLIEIAVPYLCYVWDTSEHPTTGASGYITSGSLIWIYYEIPDADPEDSNAMLAAGWEYDSDEDCFYYEAYAKYYRGGTELTDLTTINIANPYYAIRVTVRCLEDGSLGWGFDADADNGNGNQNTCAYQYLIEFVENLNSMTGGIPYLEPLLVTEEDAAANSTLRSSLDLYLTFSTDDSIETNYNSFALALKDTAASDVIVDDGELTTAANTHTAANEAMLMSSRSASESTSYNSSTSGSAGYVTPGTVVVQSNDWTDTSYTYGKKTLTVLDENGDVALDDSGEEITINSCEDGDMTLPSTVTAGTSIHNTLKWESVLYESENYSGVTNLVIYDTYGVQADVSSTGEVMSGYDVDLSSIKVQLCLTNDIAANTNSDAGSTDDNFQSTELVRGTDYEIYYTTDPLVTTEHHPITVNTLYYAADLEDLETVTWVKYDPDDPNCDGTGAMAFKIVMLDGAAKTIWNGRYMGYSNWVQCEIYVDYDAKVSEDVVAGECYPNVMAWTADVIYPTVNGTVYKSILQDTTAMFFEAEKNDYPSISKTVVDENGNNISSRVSSEEEFTYLVFRTTRTANNTSSLTMATYIKGVAAVTIHAGEKLTLDDSNLMILYNTYASGDDSAETFWDARETYYYIVEMDSGNYTQKSISFSSKNNVSGSSTISQRIGGLTTIATSITTAAATIQAQADASTDADEKAALEAQAALYLAVAEYVETSQTTQTVYFKVASGTTDWEVTVAGTNLYTSPELVIRKVDTGGAVIMNEVKFQLQDAAGNALCFTETSGGYAYEGVEGAVTASGTTTDLVFNGTTSVTGLPEGIYYLVETKAPDGYTITTASVKTEVKIAAERDTNGELVTTVEVSVENEADSTYTTGSLKLVKVNASTLLPITNGSASFQIYASNAAGSEPLAFTQDEDNGTPIAGQYTYGDGTGWTTVATDAATGTLNISGLPYGTYYLVETSAPEGYLLNFSTLATAYEFEISRTLAVTEIDLPNTYIQADIVITKTDENGNVITGNPASFALTDEQGYAVTFTRDGNGIYTYDAAGAVTTLLTSDADGTLTLKSLPKGSYTVTETGAPKGYEISTNLIRIIVENNEAKEITVQNQRTSMRLRVVKSRKTEGNSNTYAFPGVSFFLYQVDTDSMGTPTGTASVIASGTTDNDGILDFGHLDWSQIYYLYEEIPEGYSGSGDLVTVYRNDTTGEIDLTVTASTAGYTAISCLRIDMASNLNQTNSSGETYCTDVDGIWTYTQDVLNVKNTTSGGLYASTSYKTISNAKSAANYEDLEEETGYSYFYKEADYAEGNYNYVNAMTIGDTVTYTLNISNVSDYEFSNLVIIDRMPETGDTGLVNSSSARGSEFEVTDPTGIVVTVDGKEISASLYTVTYSDKVKYTDSDFNGTTSWTGTYDKAKSFRIVFDDSFTLNPGQTIVVTYDSVVGDDAKIGELAWNNFAYRYTASGGSSQTAASLSVQLLESSGNTINTIQALEEISQELVSTAGVTEETNAFTASTGEEETGTNVLLVSAGEEETGTSVILASAGAEETGISLLAASAGNGVEEVTLTPEPPKVGVLIQGRSYKLTKQWEDDNNTLGIRPDSITVRLRVQNDKTGELTDTNVTNGTVTLTYEKDISGTETITAAIVDEDTTSNVKAEASIDASGNWVCQWTGLPVLDDGYSYVAEEIDMSSAGYLWSFAKETVSGVTSDISGIITNTLKLVTLNLQKQDSDGNAIADAQFTLERQTESGWEDVDVLYSIDSGTLTATQLADNTFTTGGDGKVSIAGLPAGTYRITEVKTKDGYTLLSEPIVVKLPVTYTKDEVQQKGIDVTGSEVYLIGDSYYFYNVTYTVTNAANFDMPTAGMSAGGVWVSGFLGILLLAGAWFILRRRRRTGNFTSYFSDA